MVFLAATPWLILSTTTTVELGDTVATWFMERQRLKRYIKGFKVLNNPVTTQPRHK